MTGKRRVPLERSDARALVAAANEHGGRDNVTVVVVDVLEGEEPPHDHAPGRARRRRGPAPLGEPTVSTTDRWVPIGPSVVRRGQAVDRPRVSGRIRDLAVHRDGTRAYAATARGGVWYTDDGGSTWAPVGAWAEPARVAGGSNLADACGSILVSFGATAAQDFVMVGTGERV